MGQGQPKGDIIVTRSRCTPTVWTLTCWCIMSVRRGGAVADVGMKSAGQGGCLCGRTGAAKGTSLSSEAEGAPAVFLRPGQATRRRRGEERARGSRGSYCGISAPPKRVTPTEHRREHGKERLLPGWPQREGGRRGERAISVKGFYILALSWLSDVAVKCVNPSRATHSDGQVRTSGWMRGALRASRLSRGKK